MSAEVSFLSGRKYVSTELVLMDSNLTNGYLESYENARRLMGGKDPEQICANTGCSYDGAARRLHLRFLNTDHIISFPDGEVKREDGADVPAAVKALTAHYLLHARKTPLSGNMISFREVRGGGMNYYPVFHKRAVAPLLKAFERESEKLIRAGLGLGGACAAYGDASVTVSVFPNIPVTYVVWRGDEENTASASILFDSSVSCYLPCEDIVLAASLGAYELIRNKE
jgi:hypothetical protein